MAPKNRRHRQEGRRQSASYDQRQALQLNQRVTFKQRPQRGERSEEQRGQLLVADIARRCDWMKSLSLLKTTRSS
jgi:hypothetical protein